MGEDAPDGVEIRLVLPEVYHLDPEGPQPAITGRILRAGDGTWEEVASGADDLSHIAGPGVYRAEVLIVPEHQRIWLGTEADTFLADPKVWIYSNPIYVAVPY